MYVSSFRTHIDTTTTKRVQNDKSVEPTKRESSSTSEKFALLSSNEVTTTQKLPVNYISNYKVLSNQQKLQEQTEGFTQNSDKTKFQKISSMSNAQSAYTENSQPFSLLMKPKPTLSQTPKTELRFTKEGQSAQESTLKATMVNTYIANDNYYRITAA